MWFSAQQNVCSSTSHPYPRSSTVKLAIMQPGYLPWLGFFELMAYADLFVYFNDVQYTRQDWRNRNRVKTANGIVWLSVPVDAAPTTTSINHIRISYRERWYQKHLNIIEASYCKLPYFQPFFGELSHVLKEKYELLQDLDDAVIRLCMRYLDIDCRLAWSSDLGIVSCDKNDRLIQVCKAYSAPLLYDSKASQTFIETARFAAEGIEVVFQDYQHPQYPQRWGDFVSHLSAIDLIMNTGPEARQYLLSSPAPSQLVQSSG